MKKTLSILILILTLSPSILAAENIATPPGQKEKTQDLRQRITEKVSELRQQSQSHKVYFGEITNLGSSFFNLLDKNGENQIISVDDETKIIRIGPGKVRKNIGLAELSVSEKAVAIGQVDVAVNKFVAKKVIAKTMPKHIIGQVKTVGEDYLHITALIPNETFTIKINTQTKIKKFIPQEGIKTAELKDIVAGDKVHGTGFTTSQKTVPVETFTAIRLLVLPKQQTPDAISSPGPQSTVPPAASPSPVSVPSAPVP